MYCTLTIYLDLVTDGELCKQINRFYVSRFLFVHNKKYSIQNILKSHLSCTREESNSTKHKAACLSVVNRRRPWVMCCKTVVDNPG